MRLVAFVIGKSGRGHDVSLTPEERSWHLHILGGSGRGKSSLLESMIRQDILSIPRRGLCLIDPHGTLADDVVAWCASRRVERPVHIIDASNMDWSASFNPLRLDGMSDPSVRVEAMVAACAQVWGGEDSNRTPLLRKCLSAVFYALSVRGLTLVEATELINSVDPHHVRRKLTENLPDYVFNSLWEDFNSLKRSEFAEQFSSTTSRLSRFLQSPATRRIIGQTNRFADLKEIMDRGEILIVNLAVKNQIAPDNARLIGTLLTSELFLLAVARDRQTAKRKPFTLYIDECSEFVTDDVERMLDQTRKFGLHVVLANQRLSQLRRRSELMLDAVMGGTQTKIVFGGLMDDDAETMAMDMFRSTFDTDKPKHILDQLTVVDEEPYWLDSESDTATNATTQTTGDTSGWGTSFGTSDGSSERFDPDGLESLGRTSSQSIQSGESQSGSTHQSYGLSESYSRTSGRSQSFKPKREIRVTATYSIEEQLHRAIVRLRGLPKQAAILKRPIGNPVRITPLDVKPPATGRHRAPEFIDLARSRSSFITRAEIAEAEMAERLVDLRRSEVLKGDDQFFSE